MQIGAYGGQFVHSLGSCVLHLHVDNKTFHNPLLSHKQLSKSISIQHSTFNTPWGKFRWLRLPFRLKIASDVFQERLKSAQTTRRCPQNHRWHTHTWRDWDSTWWQAINSTWDCKNEKPFTQPWQNQVQFYRLQILWIIDWPPEGLKPDPEKVKAIVDMKPLQSIQSLQSFNGMVNYLKRSSPILTEL